MRKVASVVTKAVLAILEAVALAYLDIMVATVALFGCCNAANTRQAK
jgi:hypothetical protein